jgi:hypothetical protein
MVVVYGIRMGPSPVLIIFKSAFHFIYSKGGTIEVAERWQLNLLCICIGLIIYTDLIFRATIVESCGCCLWN